MVSVVVVMDATTTVGLSNSANERNYNNTTDKGQTDG